MLLGVILGVWLGFWVMFVGGIVQVVNTLKGNVSGLKIAFGIIKIFGAGIFGLIAGVVPIGIGWKILK